MGFPTKSPYVKVCTAPLKNAQFYCTIVIARRRVNGVSFPLRGHSLKLTSFLLSPYFFYTFPTTHVFFPRSKSLETHQPLFNQLLTTKKKPDGRTESDGVFVARLQLGFLLRYKNCNEIRTMPRRLG